MAFIELTNWHNLLIWAHRRLKRLSRSETYTALRTCFLCYLISSGFVLLVAACAYRYIPRYEFGPSWGRDDFQTRLAAGDGRAYAQLVEQGYSVKPNDASTPNFFPAFPMLAAVLAFLMHIRPELALVIISNAFLFGCFVMLWEYASVRSKVDRSPNRILLLLTFGLFPTTMFFRMAYTESMFSFFLLLAMYGMATNWRPAFVAFVIGLATLTRFVGIALIVPFIFYMYSRVNSKATFPARTICYLPLCCWGLLAFMTYQYVVFGDPFVFARSQLATPDQKPSVIIQAIDLLMFQPIAETYDSHCQCYWGNLPPRKPFVANINFANPIYFVITLVAVSFGYWNRWVTTPELLLSIVLQAIAYAAVASRLCMWSEGRYCSIIFPVYFVLANILTTCRFTVAMSLAVFSTLLLGIYTGAFVLLYPCL